MKKHLLTTAAVLGLFAGAAAATPFTDQVVSGLQAQGFDHIEIVEGSTQLKVEAIRGTTTFEIIYDLATGTVLKQETGTVEAGTDATPGVEIASDDGDFVDPADTGTGADDTAGAGADDNSTDAPEDNSSGASDDNSSDGADDNSGSETDKQSAGHADVAPTAGSDTPSMDDSADDSADDTPDQATDDSTDDSTDDNATDDSTDDSATDDSTDDSATGDTTDDTSDDSATDDSSDASQDDPADSSDGTEGN